MNKPLEITLNETLLQAKTRRDGKLREQLITPRTIMDFEYKHYNNRFYKQNCLPVTKSPLMYKYRCSKVFKRPEGSINKLKVDDF